MRQTSLHFPDTVQSVVASARNGPLIAAAATLWISDTDKVLDVTYGKGNFWTEFQPEHFTSHDLAIDGVDFRNLPESDGSVDVLVFDPPYIPQGGRDTSTIQDFLSAYGLHDAPKTDVDLFVWIGEGITEACRVLAPRGRLFVKCADFVHGGKYIPGRHRIVELAELAELEQVDEFVHFSGTGPQPPRPRQLHSRRAHSFLCVFQKL